MPLLADSGSVEHEQRRRSRLPLLRASRSARGGTLSRVQQIAPGLWRWTTPHPDWVPGADAGSPADWERWVGSVFYRGPRTAVFFDPLLAPDAAAFWQDADRRVAGGPVSVLITIGWHRRSRSALAERYGASISRAKRNLPEGVESFNLRGAGEILFWIPEHRALVVGDRILGNPDGGLRLCPESWMRYLKRPIGHAELKSMLRPLLDLPVEHVLVSHGEPVLGDGAEALAALFTV